MDEKLYTRPNGQVVAYFDYGSGSNVLFFHHATQVAGPLTTFLKDQADLHDMKIVEVVRSGHGNSTSMPGRNVWQIAPINIEIADFLGIDRFGIIGYSGGGPHALAAIQNAGPRCIGAVVVASLAPLVESNFDFYEGMNEPNKQEWLGSQSDIKKFEEEVTQYAKEWSGYDFEKLKSVFNSGPGSAFTDEKLRDFHADTQYSLQHGGEGIFEDSVAFINPWGFSVADINAPLQIWSGTIDVNAPVGHARWLHQNIVGSQLHVLEGKDHNSIVEPAWGSGFAWLNDIFNS